MGEAAGVEAGHLSSLPGLESGSGVIRYPAISLAVR